MPHFELRVKADSVAGLAIATQFDVVEESNVPEEELRKEDESQAETSLDKVRGELAYFLGLLSSLVSGRHPYVHQSGHLLIVRAIGSNAYVSSILFSRISPVLEL